MFYVYFLINFLFLFIEAKNVKLNCVYNQKYELQANKITFIESPNFPSPLKFIDYFFCFFKVRVQEDHIVEGGNFIFVLTNGVGHFELKFGALNDIYSMNGTNPIYFVQNTTEFFFSMIHLFSSREDLYAAFQGFLIYDTGNYDVECPLESISQIDSFELNDETEIIYLRSKYDKFQKQQQSFHNCKWMFTGPKGYGFKVVVHNFNSQNELTVINSTQYSIIDKNITLHHPYYNSDNHLMIKFNGKSKEKIDEFEFEAIVTLVKNQWNSSDECTFENGFWSSKNVSKQGYANNAYCSYNLSIPKDSEIIVHFDISGLEPFADFIRYTTDTGSFLLSSQYRDPVLQQDKNGLNSYAFFEYFSDGSIQSQGFEVVFIQHDTNFCKCGNQFISVPCIYSEAEYTLMGDGWIYCGELECSMNISINETCRNKYIELIVYPFAKESGSHFEDSFTVTVNQNIIMDSDNYKSNEDSGYFYYPVLLLPNNNIFNFYSVRSSIQKTMYYTLKPINPPIINRVLLTLEKPSFYVNVGSMVPNSAYSINLSNELILQNDSLEIFFSDNGYHLGGNPVDNHRLMFVSFYKDESFDSVVFLYTKLNFETKYAPSFTVDNGKIVMYKQSFDFEEAFNVFVFFRAINQQSKNCFFHANIFHVPYYNPPGITFTDISGIANASGSCEVIIMFPIYPLIVYMKNFWTTSKYENVVIHRGFEKNDKLYDFNSKTMNSMQELALSAGIYVIKIPINESIFITLEAGRPETSIIFPYRSLFTTANNGILCATNWEDYCNSTNAIITYNIENRVKITALALNFSKPSVIEFESGSKIFTFSNVGEFFVFSNTTLNIFYCECQYWLTGALFFIESIDDNILQI